MPSSVQYSTDLETLYQSLAECKRLGLDLETTGLDPLVDRIRIISITTDRGTWVIDTWQQNPAKLIQVLKNFSGLVIGHNLKFDLKFLMLHHCLEFGKVFDTFRASSMLYNGHPTITGHNLYDLQERYLGSKPDREHDYGASNWAGTLTNEQLAYAAADTQCLIQLYQVLVPRLQEAGLVDACKIEFGAVVPECEIELTGFRLDKDAWSTLASKNLEDAVAREALLLKEFPHPNGQLALFDSPIWNIDSTDQVLKSFSRLGLRLPDLDKTTLAVYQGYSAIKSFSEYRKAKKKVTSFGHEYLSNIHPVTGRIHSSYWPLTGAGRYSSSNPNLQQLPRTKDFRSCFFPLGVEDGARLVLADYSQIELRLVAQISGDPVLLGIYRKGEDAHQRTGAIISGVPLSEVTKEVRQQAKPINFGLMYGMGPPKLVIYAAVNYGVTLTLAQAELFHQRYFAAYKQVKTWHRKVWEEGKRTKLSRTLSGRLRYLDPEESFNEFKNTPVQGSGADGLKASMPLVRRNLRAVDTSIRLVHMVHDELIAEVPAQLTTKLRHDEREDLYRQTEMAIEQGMKDGMHHVLRLGGFQETVPIEAEASVCKSWADK